MVIFKFTSLYWTFWIRKVYKYRVEVKTDCTKAFWEKRLIKSYFLFFAITIFFKISRFGEKILGHSNNIVQFKNVYQKIISIIVNCVQVCSPHWPRTNEIFLEISQERRSVLKAIKESSRINNVLSRKLTAFLKLPSLL